MQNFTRFDGWEVEVKLIFVQSESLTRKRKMFAVIGRQLTILSYSAPFFDSPSDSGSISNDSSESSTTGIPPLGDGYG